MNRCVFSVLLGWAVAASAQASVVITMQPRDDIVPVGDVGVFRVGAESEFSVFYQWYVDDAPIPGAVTASYTTEPVSFGVDGLLFSVVIVDDESAVISRGAMLHVVEVPEPTVPGDANVDGVVDDKDASILGARWHQPSGANWLDGDFNDDDVVDDRDAAILAAHWHEGVGEELPSVPEPSMLISVLSLLATGALGFTCYQRRKPV
jgi:hypothetical protein